MVAVQLTDQAQPLIIIIIYYAMLYNSQSAARLTEHINANHLQLSCVLSPPIKDFWKGVTLGCMESTKFLTVSLMPHWPVLQPCEVVQMQLALATPPVEGCIGLVLLALVGRGNKTTQH